MKLAGGPIDVWALDPVALFFGQVGVNAQGAASECGAARRQLHAQPGVRSSSSPSSAACRPAPTCTTIRPASSTMLTEEKVIPVLLTPEEEKKWQRRFHELFRPR